MPIYEYTCQACGASTEILQKVSDAPATDCPGCGKPALSKTISAAGFRLAGSGWYETDFKTGAKKNLVGDTVPSASSAAAVAATPAPAASAAAPAATSPSAS